MKLHRTEIQLQFQSQVGGRDFGKLRLNKPSTTQGFNYTQFPLLFPICLPVVLTRYRGAVTSLRDSDP